MASPGMGGSGGGNGSSSGSSNGGRVKRVLVVCFKGLFLWLPASLCWLSVAWSGSPILDLRTDEEIQEDEAEVIRLERFFDVEGLSEVEATSEWTAKEAALAQILEKLLKSQRFVTALVSHPGDVGFEESGTSSSELASAAGAVELASRRSADKSQSLEAISASVEVSYVLPPPPASPEDPMASAWGGAHGRYAQASAAASSQGLPPPWAPRLMIAHRSGSLMMVSLLFEHVVKGKDREERWACTELRADLIAMAGGEASCVHVSNLSGPVPHGVRYMRV